MAKLTGKATGDVVVEWYGPIRTRNHNLTTIAPRILIKVIGSGSVILQGTQTTIMRSSGGVTPNSYSYETAADPTTWVAVGAEIDAGDGRVSRTPTVDDYDNFLRVIVVTPGDGEVIVQSDWS